MESLVAGGGAEMAGGRSEERQIGVGALDRRGEGVGAACGQAWAVSFVGLMV